MADERGITRWPNGAMCDGAVLFDPTEDDEWENPDETD